jgi:predicted dehydrogenase
MRTIRVGVIGAGHLGYHHARIYAAMPEAELVGVVEPDPARGRKAARDFGVPCFSGPAELANAGAEAVSVAVPTTAHRDIAVLLLRTGVDVLVEKPIAAAVAEAREMVHCARDLGRILQIGHIERFNGAVLALLSVVKKPRFIECHRLSPYPSRGDDVSVVLDLMIHDLEIVRAMDDSEVVKMEAVGVAVFSDCEDIANARLEFASGCVANLTCSRVSMERLRKIRIFEPDAYVSTNYAEQEVCVYRKKPGSVTPDMDPMDRISVEKLPVRRDEPLKLELESFIQCVRERARPVVAGEDGLAALEMAQRIIERIREHA